MMHDAHPRVGGHYIQNLREANYTKAVLNVHPTAFPKLMVCLPHSCLAVRNRGNKSTKSTCVDLICQVPADAGRLCAFVVAVSTAGADSGKARIVQATGLTNQHERHIVKSNNYSER